MQIKPLTSFIIFIVPLLLTGILMQAQQKERWFGPNLLKNGDAETARDPEREAVHGWKLLPAQETPTDLQVYYGSLKGEWKNDCDTGCGLPPSAGQQYFRLTATPQSTFTALQQDVDLSALKSLIQKEEIHFTLDAWLTALPCQDKKCAASAISILFYNDAGKELLRYTLEKDHHDMVSVPGSSMMKFEHPLIDKPIPAGTAKASILLHVRTEGCCGLAVGYFDNISFRLRSSK